ncbi:hypothetical protein [Anatilimnocola floriformis]|uniref:hypothetical protein n=1 Tax=Anatilimnocola floriformis TaxID=2948575 RepID=UPI0020C3ACD1|nr:hypothetical protein [Anatilimnocola floriformis]
MTFRLRDVFWLILIVGLACLLWRERTRTQRLASEARYYHSIAPPIALIDMPLEDAIATLEQAHGVKIEVDWPSVTKVTELTPRMPVTQNLVDGSLVHAVERLFFNMAIAEGTDRGIRVRARNIERDGPANQPWDYRRSPHFLKMQEADRQKRAAQKEQP